MMIDIRNLFVPGPVTDIRICSTSDTTTLLELLSINDDGHIVFRDDLTPYSELRITNLEHARNTIAAIEKAIHLGWFTGK